MKFTLCLVVCACLLGIARADEAAERQSPDLARVVGTAFLAIAKEGTVSGQEFDVPMLWQNAKLAHVERPLRKDGGTKFETEYVPTTNGIVLQFYGPYSLHETQKHWSTIENKDARTFEVLVELPAGKFIGITGVYGATFTRKAIEEIISLARTVPENHPNGAR